MFCTIIPDIKCILPALVTYLFLTTWSFIEWFKLFAPRPQKQTRFILSRTQGFYHNAFPPFQCETPVTLSKPPNRKSRSWTLPDSFSDSDEDTAPATATTITPGNNPDSTCDLIHNNSTMSQYWIPTECPYADDLVRDVSSDSETEDPNSTCDLMHNNYYTMRQYFTPPPLECPYADDLVRDVISDSETEDMTESNRTSPVEPQIPGIPNGDSVPQTPVIESSKTNPDITETIPSPEVATMSENTAVRTPPEQRVLPRSGKRKKVSFASTDQVIIIPSRQDMLAEMREEEMYGNLSSPSTTQNRNMSGTDNNSYFVPSAYQLGKPGPTFYQ